jgi:hypothetical protein
MWPDKGNRKDFTRIRERIEALKVLGLESKDGDTATYSPSENCKLSIDLSAVPIEYFAIKIISEIYRYGVIQGMQDVRNQIKTALQIGV